MGTQNLTGEMFAQMVQNGAANLRNNAQTVNDLNVFPIPDGDTGDNMCRTIEGGASVANTDADAPVSEVCSKVAEGMLLSARGNSGVILSQFFEGINLGMKDVETADVKAVAEAFRAGVKQAYSSVITPTEGTILTVMREATDVAASKITEDSTLEQFFKTYIKEMYMSLDRTPELLPVLKEAGVIDSGGAGFSFIIEGMYKALKGEEITSDKVMTTVSAEALVGNFDEDTEMEFGYCTEALVQLRSEKTDVEAFTVDALIEYLESIGGDSIVAFKTGSKVKLHVHTFTPDKVMAYCLTFGEFITVKIENMSIQHSETTVENRFERKEVKSTERKKFGVVAVAGGDGLKEMFTSLGADAIVDGQQTMNPSSEDFIKAFDAVNADTIIVLPNNSNIVMAAKQAGELYKDSDIRVVESTTIAEGYAALTMLDLSSEDIDVITDDLKMAIEGVTTGLVTYAVRDTNQDGFEIKTNDWLGFSKKTILSVEKDKVAAATALLDSIDKTGKEVIIAIAGKDATAEELTAVHDYAAKNFPMVEFYEVDGGQDIYSFIFAVE